MGEPSDLIAKDVEQTLGEADVIRDDHRAIFLKQQGAEARTAGDNALGRIHNVHVVQEGDIEDILCAWQVDKVMQRFDSLAAAAHHQTFVGNRVTGGLSAELIGIILEPGEPFEHALLENSERLAVHPGKILPEWESVQPGGIIDEGKLVGEHLLPELVLAEERKTAFHRAAVEGDPVHKIEHIGRGGSAKYDVVPAQRDLLRRVGLIMRHQESQVLSQRGRVQIRFFLGGLFGGHFPLKGGVRENGRHLGVRGLKILGMFRAGGDLGNGVHAA